MKYASIRQMDIINGFGIGTSIFFQGCPSPHCKGCFNSTTWDFNGGEFWTQEVENRFIEISKADYINHVSLLGGEPFAQPINELLHLVKRIKLEINKPIYVWTRYTLEEVLHSQNVIVLPYIDYIIDGRFEQDKRNLNLKLRGSSNQRIWHKTNQEIQKWEDITRIIDKK